MKAAIIFYFVGAIVGLFSRLYTESQSDSAIDDYGLTIARIAVIPIISGLAAVAEFVLYRSFSQLVPLSCGQPHNQRIASTPGVYDLAPK